MSSVSNVYNDLAREVSAVVAHTANAELVAEIGQLFPEMKSAMGSWEGRTITLEPTNQELVNKLREIYPDEDKLIEKYLGLDTWEPGPEKAEAVKKIIDAYKSGSTSLELTNLELTNLPAGIGKLRNLTELYLSKNRLKSLPAEIGKLTNLTYLDLTHNQLTSLPAEIWKLTNLTSLALSHNLLASPPAKMALLNSSITLLKEFDNLRFLRMESTVTVLLGKGMCNDAGSMMLPPIVLVITFKSS